MPIEVRSALSPLATPLAVANGGTAATTAAGARTNLGIGNAGLAGAAPLQCGRLTLTSGVPVTTSDVTGASTVYLTPWRGNVLSIYDGSDWVPYVFPELSRSLSGLTSGKNYDLFAYLSGGSPVIDLGPAWTGDQTRSSAVSLLNGIYVNASSFTSIMAGATVAANRGVLLGTIRTTGTNTTEDSSRKGFLSDARNPVGKPCFLNCTGGIHTYGSTTARNWANDSTNIIEWINSIPQDNALLGLRGSIGHTGGSNFCMFSVAYDGTVPTGPNVGLYSSSGTNLVDTGQMFRIPVWTVGYHSARVMETGDPTATVTFYYAEVCCVREG